MNNESNNYTKVIVIYNFCLKYKNKNMRIERESTYLLLLYIYITFILYY